MVSSRQPAHVAKLTSAHRSFDVSAGGGGGGTRLSHEIPSPSTDTTFRMLSFPFPRLPLELLHPAPGITKATVTHATFAARIIAFITPPSPFSFGHPNPAPAAARVAPAPR